MEILDMFSQKVKFGRQDMESEKSMSPARVRKADKKTSGFFKLPPRERSISFCSDASHSSSKSSYEKVRTALLNDEGRSRSRHPNRNPRLMMKSKFSKMGVDQYSPQNPFKRSATIKKEENEVQVEISSEEDLPEPGTAKALAMSKKQILQADKVIAALREHWAWIFENAVVKKRRKILLKEDNYCVDFEIKDKRQLLTPPEHYLDVTKLEKYGLNKQSSSKCDCNSSNQDKPEVKLDETILNIPEPNEPIPLGLLEILDQNIRQFLCERCNSKRGLIHLGSLAKLLNCDLTDLVRKQKPYENKLLKNPRKRIKRRIQERVIKGFVNEKDLPKVLYGINASPSSRKNSGLNQKVLDKLDTLLQSEMNESSGKSEESDDMNILEDSGRVSILQFIRAVRSFPGGYIETFRKCSQLAKTGELRLKIHGFSTLCSALLDLEVEESNINSLFLTIDKDKNGHIDEDEFVNTIEMINNDGSIKNKKACTRLVVDQLYQELMSKSNLSLRLLQRSLNKEGYIQILDLMHFLKKYKIDISDEELELIYEENGKVGPKGERLIFFRKLIEDSISRSNAVISFKINAPRRGSLTQKSTYHIHALNDGLGVETNKTEFDEDLETSYYSSEEEDEVISEASSHKESGSPKVNWKSNSRKNFVQDILASKKKIKLAGSNKEVPLLGDPESPDPQGMILKVTPLNPKKAIQKLSKDQLPADIPSTHALSKGPKYNQSKHKFIMKLVNSARNTQKDSNLNLAQTVPTFNQTQLMGTKIGMQSPAKEKVEEEKKNGKSPKHKRKLKANIIKQLNDQQKEMLTTYIQNQEKFTKIVGSQEQQTKMNEQLRFLELSNAILTRSETKLKPHKQIEKPAENQPKPQNEGLLVYLNCKEPEKERIVSCFLKIFEYLRSYKDTMHKEDKKITVAQFTKIITDLYPSITAFSAKKVKAILRFHCEFGASENVVDQAKLEEFIHREKEIVKLRKATLKAINENQDVWKSQFAEPKEERKQEKEYMNRFEIFKSITKPLDKKPKNQSYQNQNSTRAALDAVKDSENKVYAPPSKLRHIFFQKRIPQKTFSPSPRLCQQEFLPKFAIKRGRNGKEVIQALDLHYKRLRSLRTKLKTITGSHKLLV